MSGFRAVLRHADLRRVFGALVLSSTGSWAYNVALLVFVYERTGSTGWVGAAALARFLPQLLASAYAGIIAERVERVRLMVRSDLAAMVFQAGLAVVAAADGPVVLALVFTALTALVIAPYEPAAAALLPQIASEDELVAANALRGTIDNLVVIAGPGIGAGLLALGSPTGVFAINAGSFLLSALIVSRVRTRSVPSDTSAGGTAGPLRQIADGFMVIVRSREARPLVALCALASFVYGTDTVVLVAAADQRLGMGQGGFGVLIAALGVGGLLIAPVVDRLASGARLAPVLIGGMAVFCLPTLAVALTHSAPLGVAAQLFRGAGTLVVDVLAVTALQRSVAPNMVARVFGIFFAIVLGSIALGTLITPFLISALGLQATLVVLALGPLALSLTAAPSLVRLDGEAAARSEELAPRIAALERVGLFEGAGRPLLERLAGASEEQDATAGATIVREGDEADALYVLLAGRVDVRARGETGGEEQHLRELGAGAVFGEIGLLERIPRTATVTAVEDCRLLRIDGEAFLDGLTAIPATGVLLEDARSRLARTHPSRAPSEMVGAV